MPLSKDTKTRLTHALTDEKAADEVESAIDNAGSGGGGGGSGEFLGTLSEDPSSPTDGQSWNLAVDDNITTWSIADLLDNGEIALNVASITVQEFIDLYEASAGEDFGTIGDYFIDIADGGSEDVSPDPGSRTISISYDGPNGGNTSTVQTMVNAMNAYSQARISKDMASVIGTGSNNFDSVMGEGQDIVNTDVEFESVKAKVRHNGKTFSTNLTEE